MDQLIHFAFRREHEPAAVPAAAGEDGDLHAVPDPPERLRLLRHLLLPGPRLQQVCF